MIPAAHDMFTARAMMREGFSLHYAAKKIGWSSSDLDLALWRYCGRLNTLPTGHRSPAFLAGRT